MLFVSFVYMLWHFLRLSHRPHCSLATFIPNGMDFRPYCMYIYRDLFTTTTVRYWRGLFGWDTLSTIEFYVRFIFRVWFSFCFQFQSMSIFWTGSNRFSPESTSYPVLATNLIFTSESRKMSVLLWYLCKM